MHTTVDYVKVQDFHFSPRLSSPTILKVDGAPVKPILQAR